MDLISFLGVDLKTAFAQLDSPSTEFKVSSRSANNKNNNIQTNSMVFFSYLRAVGRRCEHDASSYCCDDDKGEQEDPEKKNINQLSITVRVVQQEEIEKETCRKQAPAASIRAQWPPSDPGPRVDFHSARQRPTREPSTASNVVRTYYLGPRGQIRQFRSMTIRWLYIE